MQVFNALADPRFTDAKPNKVNAVKTDQIETDVYYFRPGQQQGWHRHSDADHALICLAGAGDLVLDSGTELRIPLRPGTVALAPRGVWHAVHAGSEPLTVAQLCKFPSKVEERG